MTAEEHRLIRAVAAMLDTALTDEDRRFIDRLRSEGTTRDALDAAARLDPSN